MFEVVQTIKGWKQFCRYLHLQDKPNRKEVIKFFVEEPYFEASWKKVALSLYYSSEEDAIDKLFRYMKSPTGHFLHQDVVILESLKSIIFIFYRSHIDSE